MNILLQAPDEAAIPLLKTLIQELYDHEVMAQTAEGTFSAVEALLANPQLGHIWMIQIDDPTRGLITVGHVAIAYSFSIEHGGKVAYMDQLYLRKEWRNQGIGQYILPRIERFIHQQGASVLLLETNIGNGDARRFYERHGYVARRQFCLMGKKMGQTDTTHHAADEVLA
ncbi:hypothetical protein VST7929_01253 [Vibrio stylophorae]|uniref:N-acetyltransferase domain-containing protein n=1 Tax=Vibrio stylophorae TaxID=659351 RepID=A0ABM8ZSY4_9VIBR|nr:GNAT family N-acetyltransferase [Vibrio stylophorae]CAH0533387.1 hypothetical protein VST7929_01253 [Vibrio stylophorae]